VSNFDVDDIEEAVAIAGAGRIASTIGSTRSKQASSARRTGLRLARLGVECGEDGAARAPRPPESPCRPLGSTARGCCYSGGRQMAQTQTKEVVRQLLDRLPDDCTIEDVQYHLYVIASVEQGRAEITAGQGIPHEQVKAELRRKWLRPDDE
jgi:predicted transcriptional regulator